MIKNWKLEITEAKTRLIIRDGAVMNSDILNLARHLVMKYHLNKLPIYHENGSKFFDYASYGNNNFQMKPFKKVTDSNLPYFLKKAEELIHAEGYAEELGGIRFALDVPKQPNGFADCLLCIDFLDGDDETERPSELYLFDLLKLKWVKAKKDQKIWKDVMITNINWDTSDDVKVMAGLPDEVNALVLNINFSNYNPNDDLDYNEDFLYEVSDALTNKYGFCHDGFEVEIRRKRNE